MAEKVSDTQRLAVLKHLGAGRSAAWVAQAEGLTEDAVIMLARSHGYPDASRMAWAASVIERDLALTPTDTSPSPAASPSPRVVPRPTPPGELDRLLARAAKSPSKATQAAGQRAAHAIDVLRNRLADDDQRDRVRAEKARRAAAAKAEREAAAAKIRELEAEIAALRGKTRPSTIAATAREIRAWAKEQGLQVADTARLPTAIRQAYDAAHPGSAA